MNHDMFFVPLIVEAYRQPDPRSALARAFAEIVRLGQMPEYRNGYEQFVHWMQLVAAFCEEVDRQGSDEDLMRPSPPTHPMRFQLYRDGRPFGSFALLQGGPPAIVDRVRPGRFRLLFETGWAIWEHALTGEDLLWHKAHPRSPVPMAADDGRRHERPAREICLPGTNMVICVSPGLGAGRLTFQLKPHEVQC
jgi:hypothetical protein